MLLIPCPHCGERDETEFRYGGERRPSSDTVHEDTTPIQIWGDHLFLRDNLAGKIEEKWFHLFGCRHWITLVRDTRTDVFTNQPEMLS